MHFTSYPLKHCFIVSKFFQVWMCAWFISVLQNPAVDACSMGLWSLLCGEREGPELFTAFGVLGVWFMIFNIFSTFFNYLGDIPNDIYRLLLRDGLKSLRECNCSSEERLRCTLDTTCARLAVLKIYSNPQKDRHVKSCLNSLELLVYLFGEYYTMKYLNK